MTKIYSRVKTNLTNNRGQSKGALVFGIAISAVILLIIGVVLAWMFLSSGEISIEKAVNAYYEALSNNNVDEYVSTCYTNKWAENYKENGQSVDIKDAVEKVFSYQSGATFGEAHIISAEKIDKQYAEKMTEVVNQIYDVDVKVTNITKVQFSVDMTFEGDSTNSGTIVRYCYKTGGKWYFLSDTEVFIQLGLEG